MAKTSHNHLFTFFLGGHDLEMKTISELLKSAGISAGNIKDKNLAWGADVNAYRDEIDSCLASGRTPVLIELDDENGDYQDRVIIIDHHNERAGKDNPTSLHQVFSLLKLPLAEWSRWFELVAVNDRGYIPALVAAGAARQEIVDVRAQDRRAQGVTEADENAARQALKEIELFKDGMLTVARLPHNRTSSLCDRLDPALGGAGYRNLLVFSPDEVNFFGTGDLVLALSRKFSGGWYGGALPDSGFWGRQANSQLQNEIRDFTLSCLRFSPDC